MKRITNDTELKRFMAVIGRILDEATKLGGIHKLQKEVLIYYDQLSCEVKAYEARRLAAAHSPALQKEVSKKGESPFIGMDIFLGSFQTDQDEFAWKPKDVERVIAELGRMGNAILGGDVSIVRKDSTIEQVKGSILNTHEKFETESWDDYVLSSGIQFLNFFRETRNKPDFEALGKKYNGEVFFMIEFLNEPKCLRLLEELEKREEEEGYGE